jgi:hypothetical protein
LFVTPELVLRAGKPVSVVLEDGLTRWAICRHVGLVLLESRTNREDAVNEFSDKSVFGNAERTDGCSMCLPVNRVKSLGGPAVAVAEVGGDDGLTG